MWIIWYAVTIIQTVYGGVTCLEMPVFAPNDYFWKKHWDGKENKADLYGETLRKIMAETGGFKLSDSTVDDKLELKKLLKGRVEDKKTE